MKIQIPPSILLLSLSLTNQSFTSVLFCQARKSSSSNNAYKRPSRHSSRSTGSSSGISSTKRRDRKSRYEEDLDQYDQDQYDEEDFGGMPGEEDFDEYDDDDEPLPSSSSRGAKSPHVVDEYDDMEEEDDFDYGYDDYYPEETRSSSRRGGRGSSNSRSDATSSRSSRKQPRSNSGKSSRSSRTSSRQGSGRSSGRGGVVPYNQRQRRQPQPTAFTRGLSYLRESIPDANTIKEKTMSSISAAKESTNKLSANIYREVKGLTSSELEQVMLKATKPDDTPVKGKHVERLVGVTYQISGRYDIYDSVLRKLWNKIAEKDWRTTIKALYILHRFSVDGAPDHQAALKARLRELRRSKDPKRKEKYFNRKILLAVTETDENLTYRAFLARYAHYVLLRAQCFGGLFTELTIPTDKSPSPSSKGKKSRASSSSAAGPKLPITSTCLKNEHLEASQMLLEAGLACQLKPKEECENTAIAVERVVTDLIAMTTAIAKSLNAALGGKTNQDLDWALLKKWCQFYSAELLPQTKGLMKKTSPTLDAFGLYLPSRMGASVSQDLLQKGLKGVDANDEESLLQEEDEELEDKPVAVVEEEEDIGQKVDDTIVEEEEDDEAVVEDIRAEEGVMDEYDEEYEYEYYDEE